MRHLVFWWSVSTFPISVAPGHSVQFTPSVRWLFGLAFARGSTRELELEPKQFQTTATRWWKWKQKLNKRKIKIKYVVSKMIVLMILVQKSNIIMQQFLVQQLNMWVLLSSFEFFWVLLNSVEFFWADIFVKAYALDQHASRSRIPASLEELWT